MFIYLGYLLIIVYLTIYSVPTSGTYHALVIEDFVIG